MHDTGLIDESDLKMIPWRALELAEGESITGRVLRLPTPRAFNGSRLFLATPDEVVALPATGKRGHVVLERELVGIKPGDRVQIAYLGWRTTADGERTYRLYSVERS